MTETKQKSPQALLKNSQLLCSSPNLTNKLNNRSYLPSRYAQDRKIDKIGFQNILNSIQTKINNQSKPTSHCNNRSNSPKLKINTVNTNPNTNTNTINNQLNQVNYINEKRLKTSQFRSRPLKRQKSDQLQFNQIFLNPRQQALQQLKKKSYVQDNIKTISKEYQKLLKFQDNNNSNNKDKDKDKDNSQQKSAQDSNTNSNTNTNTIKYNYQQQIQLLQSGTLFGLNIQSNLNNFYDNHILVQPPDFPISTTQQTTSPGTSYAPSIPSNYKSYKNLNIKQLLMRVRTGLNNQDIQKQAHLSYFLGQVYAQNKIYTQALKFHKRYLGFAKLMQDVVGMSLGANRVAIDFYNCGQIQKSIIFHNENLKLSNNQNCFVGFYNIGICYRKMNKLQQAMQYFQSALSWSQQKGQQQSQCIILGQIALTYQQQQNYQQAIQKFQKSNQICQKINKYDLKLNNLRYIIRISSILQLGLKSIDKIKNIVEEAFISAKEYSNINMIDIFRCNIGIVRGMENIRKELGIYEEVCQVQEI